MNSNNSVSSENGTVPQQPNPSFFKSNNNMNTIGLSKTNPNSIFQKIRIIGKSASGTIYELTHLPTGKSMAAKSIPDEIRQKSSPEYLLAEMGLLKQVTTPFTVQNFGSIIFQNHFTVVTEFCSLGSFRNIMNLTGKPLSIPQLKIVIHDLLAGVTLLHSNYLIPHQNIKASNVLLCDDGKIKIGDFKIPSSLTENIIQYIHKDSNGQLNNIENTNENQNNSENQVGINSNYEVPYWLPPEVLNGQEYTFASDSWSIGATVIELFEGAPPYAEFPPERAKNEILTRGFSGFRNGSQPPQDLVDFVTCCTSKDLKMRVPAKRLLLHPFLSNCDQINRNEAFAEFQNIDLTLSEDQNQEYDRDFLIRSQFSSFILPLEDNEITPDMIYQPVSEELSEMQINSALYNLDDSIPPLGENIDNSNSNNESDKSFSTPKAPRAPPPLPPGARKNKLLSLSHKTNKKFEIGGNRCNSAKFDRKDILLPPIWDTSGNKTPISLKSSKRLSRSAAGKKFSKLLNDAPSPKAAKELLRERSDERFLVNSSPEKAQINIQKQPTSEPQNLVDRIIRNPNAQFALLMFLMCVVIVASKYSYLLAIVMAIAILYYFAYM
ncbi:hypothetical protein TRFO_29102 [Tritrichomonas foetus]|uniref:Protein kinase domain-containing protein n=1 Tax=Tritrichomonas foetus TaxID=1144522 RepID=A0A1J4JWI2_9EUKA|nr:hypothetical protein TRFO_29102 [Tritrichomonas foetus]|eukprot:OHT03503.1 hypothetical protein TRFO_29102 [Tritrichomonas foetus]